MLFYFFIQLLYFLYFHQSIMYEYIQINTPDSIESLKPSLKYQYTQKSLHLSSSVS